MAAILKVQNLTKLFGSGVDQAWKMLQAGRGKADIFSATGATVAVDDVSFAVDEGETLVIIGLSGSGKSTVIRCLNRLHHPTAGQILFKGRDIVHFSRKELLDYRRNRASMVFQNVGLISHRNVLDNVAFGLEIRGMAEQARYEKSRDAIALVGLAGQEQRRIDALSGGMKQRVGLARALANDPDLMLMDEPFSALDPIMRRDLQAELLKIQKKVKKTIVFITHDINEAFRLGHKIAIMKDGKWVQTGTPEAILAHPVDQYVSDFIRDVDRGLALSAWHVLQEPGHGVVTRQALGGSSPIEWKQRTSGFMFVVDDGNRLMGCLRPAGVAGADAVMAIPSFTLDTPLRGMLAALRDGQLDAPIGITDADGGFRGYTTGKFILAALA